MPDRNTSRRPLLTVAESADFLNVSTRTVRRKIDEGALAVVRIGRSVRIDPADLEALIAKGRSVKNVIWCLFMSFGINTLFHYRYYFDQAIKAFSIIVF
jgi:excisionase family DNA binding protein